MQRTRWGIFCSLGVCLFLFGIILAFCRTVRSKRRCRRRVNAVICDVDVSWTDDDFTDFFITNYKYHPVYQYTLDGQEYRVVSRVEYSKKDEIKVGSYEVLFVDEKNPRYFSCPSENRERVISALIWSVLGVAFALFPLVGWAGGSGFWWRWDCSCWVICVTMPGPKIGRSDCILLSKYIVLYLKYIA